MLRSMLKSKIHRAVVTQTELDYEGSLTLDRALMDAADILPNERVMVYNISNGERFDTYIIEGEADSGIVCLNGAAARKCCVGNLIIIVTYAILDEREIKEAESTLVLLSEENRILKIQKSPMTG